MNKSFKPVIILAVLAVFGVANAQVKVTAPKVEVTAPKAEVPAAPKAEAPAAPAAATPAAPAHTAPAATAPAVPAATAPAAPAHTAPAATAPAAPATHAAPAATAPAAPATHAAPAVAEPATPVAPVVEAQAPVKADSASAPVAEVKPQADSTIVLMVEEPKKKKRSTRPPKNEFAVVDVPANFEIQAKKIMPITDPNWGSDNLDTWWGRANLMVLTESENFVGKVHLRMYPGRFYAKPDTSISGIKLNQIAGSSTDRYGASEVRDVIQLYEAWAWHRGDYVNLKIGRWDNTTRFGSKTFGGYVDAKKDKNSDPSHPSVNYRQKGFMSTYTPENAVQFGLNNFSENISLDIALVSGDEHLNKGDLRVYFSFKNLAGLENVDVGLGYRSNVFDEIYSKDGDVTHTVDFGFRMPLAKEVGILKSLNLFAEAALIGLDDQIGENGLNDAGNPVYRGDKGGSPHDKGCDPSFPILGGLDFSLYQGLDKIVLEAEFDGKRKTASGSDGKKIQGSIYVQKVLSDRFTLNLGVQSENNTWDFSFAGRLQGRIN